MEKKFTTSQAGLEWMKTELPEKTLVSIANFIWSLCNLPMSHNDAAKEDQIREKFRQEFEVAQKPELNAIHQELGQERGKSEALKEENKTLKEDLLKNIFEIREQNARFMGTNVPSAVIGQNGEDWVFQLLNDDPNMKIEHVATGSGGGLGDFAVSFKHSNVKVMLDVKNHKKNDKIKKDEREKFIRDLEENAE